MTDPEVFTNDLIDRAVERMRAGMKPATAVASLLSAAMALSDRLVGPAATQLMLELAAQTHRGRAAAEGAA